MKSLETTIGIEMYRKIDKTVFLYSKGQISLIQLDSLFSGYISQLNRENAPDEAVSAINNVYLILRGHNEIHK